MLSLLDDLDKDEEEGSSQDIHIPLHATSTPKRALPHQTSSDTATSRAQNPESDEMHWRKLFRRLDDTDESIKKMLRRVDNCLDDLAQLKRGIYKKSKSKHKVCNHTKYTNNYHCTQTIDRRAFTLHSGPVRRDRGGRKR